MAPLQIGFGLVGMVAGVVAGMVKGGAKLYQIQKKGVDARTRKPDSKGRQKVKAKVKRRKETKGRKVRGVSSDPGKKSPKEAADALVADKGGDKKKARQAAVYLMNVNSKRPKQHEFWKKVVSLIKFSSSIKVPKPTKKVIKMRTHKRRAAMVAKKKKPTKKGQ